MTHTDALSQIIEAACEAALKRTLRMSDISPRRLLTVRETAAYLSLSEGEVYSMLANKDLVGIRRGKRIMIDIRDLEDWIASHKTE
jgi:excisionase family DNA binding protein